MKLVASLGALIGGLLCSVADRIGSLPGGERYVSGQAVVGYKVGFKTPSVGEKFGEGKVLQAFAPENAFLISIPTNRPILAVLKHISKHPRVQYTEPNYVYRNADYTPNDPMWSLQWGAERIGCTQAWGYTTGSSTVYIAVLDSGVQYTHPDLNAHYAGGHDYQDNDSEPMDEDGHGTHVAGVAAAVTDNGIGIAGVGFNCRFLAVRVGTNNAYPESKIVSGINYAVSAGAHVINLSLGGYAFSSAIQSAINSAWSAGVVVCAAAGNDAVTTPFYPAAYTNCIAVAGTTGTNTLASFSNRGSWVDIAAPAVGIQSTYLGGAYQSLSGTSMASPMVAGAAALIYSALGGIRSAAAAQAIRDSLELRSVSFTGEIGGGRLDAYDAVLRHVNVPPTWQVNNSYGSGSLASPFEIQAVGTTAVTLYKRGPANACSVPSLARVTSSGNSLWFSEEPPPPWDFGFYSPGAVVQYGPYTYIAAAANDGYCVMKYSTSTGDLLAVSAPIALTPGCTGSSYVPVDMAYLAGYLYLVGPTTTDPDTGGFTVAMVDIVTLSSTSVVYDSSFPLDTARFLRADGTSVYVGGETKYVSGKTDFLLVKFNTSLTRQWVQRWDGGMGGSEVCQGMDLLSGGASIYLSGLADDSLNPSYVQYNSSGSLTASAKLTGYANCRSCGIKNEFMSFMESAGGQITTHLVHFIGSGTVIAHTTFSIPDGGILDYFCSRPRYSLYGQHVAAYVKTSSSQWDSIVVKFDAVGQTFLWAGRYYGGLINQDHHGEMIDVCSDGTVVVAKAYSGASYKGSVLGYSVSEGGNTSTGNVGGHADLDQYLGSGGLSGTIDFREPGTLTALFSAPVTVDGSGNFIIPNVPLGAYDVSFKVANWLRQTLPGITVQQTGNAASFSLSNGDADGDNTVTLFDLNTELLNFGSDGSEGGDLDWDGMVGLFDLNVALVAFGSSGDP